MKSSEQLETWADCGFPKIEFLPGWLPMRGLNLALLERWKCVMSTRQDADEVVSEERPEVLEPYGNGRPFLMNYDRTFAQVAGWYLNHLETDFTDLRRVPRWDFKSLAAALDEEWIDPSKGDLSPALYSGWALQRYRMLNLLKFAPVDYEVKILAGSEHTGIPTSPGAAVEAAMKNCGNPRVVLNGTIGRFTRNIWGPDHGWKYGSYCADVTQSGGISVVIPEELKATGKPIIARLYLNVDSPDGDPDHFDAYGTGIHIGLNVFEADENGYFTEWELPAVPDAPRWPSKGKTTSYGFDCRDQLCVADYSSIFKFFDEVEDAEN